MPNWLQSFVLTFVPLFIVIDAIGNVPFLVSMTEGVSAHERDKMVHVATLTASVVGLVFLFFGQFILTIMGISVGSFAVAGGIVLLVLSIKYMTTGHMVEVIKGEMVSVVPIGTPLTVGPATITTLIILDGLFPLYLVLLSFALNMVVVWVVFLLGNQIARFLGEVSLKAFSRVLSLLLSAIAVSMIFRGLELLGILKTAG